MIIKKKINKIKKEIKKKNKEIRKEKQIKKKKKKKKRTRTRTGNRIKQNKPDRGVPCTAKSIGKERGTMTAQGQLRDCSTL